MPTGRNGSLRLAISAKASSPASSSMYLRVRPGVDTGRRRTGWVWRDTDCSRQGQSLPAKLLRAVVARLLGRKASLRTHTRSPRVDLVSCFPRCRGGRGGGDWYRAGASALAPVVASPPTPASLSGAAEAKRGEAGSRRGRRPPSSAAASSPAGPQAAGSLTLASHRHSSLRFVFTQWVIRPRLHGVPDDLGCRPSAVLAESAVEPVSGT